jgi:hypothetical protein
MPYAFVQDIAASWEQYQRFAAALEGPAPHGLILHAAGPTDEGFRIIGVWEDEDAWLRFRDERLNPGAEAVAHIAPTFRGLRLAHIVGPEGRPHAGIVQNRPASKESSSSCRPRSPTRSGRGDPPTPTQL